jgi:hypothetical protein
VALALHLGRRQLCRLELRQRACIVLKQVGAELLNDGPEVRVEDLHSHCQMRAAGVARHGVVASSAVGERGPVFLSSRGTAHLFFKIFFFSF